MIFVIIATLLYVHLAASQQCTIFNEQNIIGNDIGVPTSASSMIDCCVLCGQDPACAAVVYQSLQCFKKSVKGPRSTDPTASTATENWVPTPPPGPPTPAPPPPPTWDGFVLRELYNSTQGGPNGHWVAVCAQGWDTTNSSVEPCGQTGGPYGTG